MSGKQLKETLQRIWTGKSTKSEYFWYFILAFSIYIFGIIYAAAVYPGGFTMLSVYVSYLGGSEVNPPGFRIYNACEFLTGILLLPHFLYTYHRLMPTMKFLTRLSTLFGFIGCLGFASLGIFYQGFNATGHRWATIFSFGGFGVSAFFMLIIYIRKGICLKQWPKGRQIFIVYGIMFAILGITLFVSEFKSLFTSWNIDPRYFEDKFWEWFYLLIIIVWLFGIIMITPKEEKITLEKPKQ